MNLGDVGIVEVPDPDTVFDLVLRDAEPWHRDPVERSGTLLPAQSWRAWWTAAADAVPYGLRHVLETGFVLTVSDCDAVGISRSRRRNEIAQGRWTDAGYGAVGLVDVRDHEVTREGAARARRRRHAVHSAGTVARRPRATVTGRSSAILHGLPTRTVPTTPELTEREVGNGRRGPAHLYPARLPEAEIDDWYGVAVESVGRTLVTLARHGRWDALMAADAALREDLIDRDGIARALETAVGWPWVRQARAVLALADPLTESPLESVTRLRLHDSGFPDPELQVWLGADRVDFWWRKYGLVLEADGDVKYVGDASLREKQRERRLLRHPDVRRVERLGWADVTTGWATTRRDLLRNFR